MPKTKEPKKRPRRGKGRKTPPSPTLEDPPDLPEPEEDEDENNGTLSGRATESASATDADPSQDDWLWLGSHTDADWNQMLAYLWRTHPITDRSGGGRPTSIEKFARRFDSDTVMKAHGSGRYRVDVVKVNPDTGTYKRIRQFYFTIRNMKYPPQVPLGDWVDDPANEAWQWAAEPLRKQQGSKGGAVNEGQLFNTVLSAVERIQGKSAENPSLAAAVMEMVKTSNERLAAMSDPVKQLTTIKELIAAVTPAKTGDDSLMKTILEMQREETRALRDELRQMRAQPQKSIVEQLVEAAPAIKEIGKLFGFNGKSSETSEWVGVAKDVVGELGKHVPEFLAAWKLKVMHEANTNGKNGTATGNWKGSKPKSAEPEKAAAQVAAAANPAEQAKDERQEFVVNKYGQLMQAVAPFMIDHFKTGLGGAEFRNWFISRHGIMTWTALRDECGVETLVELTQLHPTLQTVLTPVDKFTDFTRDFFADPEPYTEEEAVEPEVISAPGARA